MSADGEAPPLAEYSLIGDCHGSALVSGRGSIDWCCLPRFDSGSCFGRLLDWEKGGHCAVRFSQGPVQSCDSSYVKDTRVRETILQGEAGSVRVLDCFAMREHGAQQPRREIVRIIECQQGSADIEVQIAPRFDYGSVRPWLRRAEIDVFTAIGGDDGLLIWSDGELDSDGESLCARASLHAGERLRLLMRFVRPHLLEHEQTSDLGSESVDTRLSETIEWWQRWRERLHHDGVDQEAVVRSALTLKALTYAPTGAIVAAPTASLPETLGGERNWDYRFSWIRDSALTANALAEMGCGREAERFRHFIVRSSAGHADDLQILFGIGGERRISEQELDLAGYRESRPVRIGNAAYQQAQHDVWGVVVDSIYLHTKSRDRLDDRVWKMARQQVERALERWRDPDRGIWEVRGEPRHFTSSKVMCWVAADRGARLALLREDKDLARTWRKAADEIHADICANALDDRGVFCQHYDTTALDASLLLMPLLRFLPADDPRIRATVLAIADELTQDGLVLRYQVDETDDGLSGEEGTFTICSFWLVSALTEIGEHQRAREICEKVLSYASPLLLYGEEIDSRTGRHLGNFPQAFTHLALINAVMHVIRKEQAAQRLAMGREVPDGQP